MKVVKIQRKLASAGRLEKVLNNIVKVLKERRFVVVSAPANAMLKIPR